MSHPYRSKLPDAPRDARRRRARVGSLALAVGVLWLLGVSRFALAIGHDEPAHGEPALAALLTVVPPIALLFRSVREALARDDTRPTRSQTR